jgi:hypothetical protein
MMVMMIVTVAVMMIRASHEARMLERDVLARSRLCAVHRACACFAARAAMIGDRAPTKTAGMGARCGSPSAHPSTAEVAAAATAAMATAAT